MSRRSAVAVLAAGGLLTGSAEGSDEGDELAGVLPVLPRLDDLAKFLPASNTKVAFVAGALRPGLGQAFYRRVPHEPFHAGKVRSADGAWWEISPGEIVNVTQFGAVGDGEHDDTKAIQDALDYAIYSEQAPRRVFLPSLKYSISQTLHVGYGDRFVTLEVFGEPGLSGAQESLRGIFPRFNDRPCLNIQGGRRVRLRGLTIIGVNRDHVREHYDHMEDRGRRSDWLGSTLGPNSDSEHAPYAGMTVDAYAGPQPPIPYPPVKYPDFVGSTGQYGKNFSSGVILEDCRIEGFCVAVAVQPGLTPDASNGDFTTYRDCSFNFNVVAIADGHSDSRCTNVDNTRMHFCHTAIDARTYGRGEGMLIGKISGSSFDNVWRILNINIGGSKEQWPYPLNICACYGESIYHLGGAYSVGAAAPGISFNGCKFEFSVKNKEFSPSALFSCRSGTAVFRDCVFQGGIGFAVFDAKVELDGVSFSHLQGEIFDKETTAGRIAKSFSGEFWARAVRGVRLSPSEFFEFSGRPLEFARIEGLDSGAFAVDREANVERGGRPIPWWVENLADEHAVFPSGKVPSLSLDRSQEGVEISKADGAEYDIVLPRDWLASLKDKGLETDYLFGAGDIVEDRDGGLLAYVVAVATPTDAENTGVKLRLRQLTAVRTLDFGKNWEIERCMVAERGILAFHNARRFYPFAVRATMETQKGQAVTRLAPRETPAKVSADPPFVEVGDYMASNRFGSAPNERLFSRCRVLAVDPHSMTLTLDSASGRDFWGDCAVFVKGRPG